MTKPNCALEDISGAASAVEFSAVLDRQIQVSGSSEVGHCQRDCRRCGLRVDAEVPASWVMPPLEEVKVGVKDPGPCRGERVAEYLAAIEAKFGQF